MQNDKRIYIQSFTSLRGIAALVVLWAHTTGYYVRPDWLEWCIAYTPIKLLLDSGVAVNLFFVLSGFVLSINFLSKDQKNNYQIDRYFFYRIIRICFPFWLVLLVSYIAHQHLHQIISTQPESLAHKLWSSPVSTKDFILDALLVKANHSFYFIPQAWTLAIELKISLLMPLFIYFAQRNNLWLIVFTLSCVLIFKQPHYVFNFCCGVLIAKYFQQLKAIISNCNLASKLIILLLASFCCSLPQICNLNYHQYIYFGVLTHAIGTSLILIAALGFDNLLNRSWVVYIGTISYSLYLTHMLVLWLITPYFVKFLNLININSEYAKVLILVFSSLAAILLASITYHCFEKPSISYGKKLINLYQKYIVAIPYPALKKIS